MAIRTFLEKNKIYFDTLGTAIPSFIAVVVAIAALIISIDSRDITDKQTEIAKNSSRPLLSARMDPKLDDNLRLTDSAVVLINQGQLVRSASMKVLEFLKIECGLIGKGVWEIKKPIKGYYKYKYLTGEVTGVIARLIPEDHFHRMGDLYSESLDFERNGTGDGYATPFFESLVVLEYETIYGEKSVEYFLASPHGSRGSISKQKAADWIGIWNGVDDPDFDHPWFSEITGESLRVDCGI